MKTLKIKRSYFESHKTNLNLTEIEKNKYLYKKKFKYKIKKMIKVTGLILWIPLMLPVTFPLFIISSLWDSIKEYIIALIESIKSNSYKNYLSEIKEEFESIFDVILDIE